jgi:NTP pyrophosphatase (non-canonical NTP hydrolase)
MTTINDIGREAHEINAGNGWDVFGTSDFPADVQPITNPEAINDKTKVRFLSTHMALVHSEVSEATEAIRHRDRENFDEELADVVIRVASIAHGLGTDLDSVIRAKLAKNRKRGLHHGGKAV